MMRFKITGFTRFLLIMVVLVPFAFVIASYYNGKNGIEELKKLIKGQSTLISPVKNDTLDEAVVIPVKTIDKKIYEQLVWDQEALKDSLLDLQLKIRELERNLKLCKGK
jgi:hypothetical protein